MLVDAPFHTTTSPTNTPLTDRLGSMPMAMSGAAFAPYQIIRRNGAVVSFEPSKIAVALMKAFLAVHGSQGAASVRFTAKNAQ